MKSTTAKKIRKMFQRETLRQIAMARPWERPFEMANEMAIPSR